MIYISPFYLFLPLSSLKTRLSGLVSDQSNCFHQESINVIKLFSLSLHCWREMTYCWQLSELFMLYWKVIWKITIALYSNLKNVSKISLRSAKTKIISLLYIHSLLFSIQTLVEREMGGRKEISSEGNALFIKRD